MNENVKNILIKIILTVPAIILGFVSTIFLIFKPLKELWFPSKFKDINLIQNNANVIDTQQIHDFH